MLSNMHKGTQHTGKVPKHLAERFKRKQHISALQQELNEAVASEEYETAAKLRDTLKQMEITTVE
ncbi:MAG: UvrB/UvrC motif-containing protein [Chthoniobacterales bacterium]